MIKDFFKRFFYETFKRREKEEYEDLFCMNRKTNYPWFYSRIIIFYIIAIIVLTFMFNIFGVSTDEQVLVLSSIFIPFAFFFLVYELVRVRELSFFQIVLIILLSQATTVPLILFIHFISEYFMEFKTSLSKALRAGICEEIIKGFLACLLIYLINKQRNKNEKGKLNDINAFLIGCSVGIGFAIAENFGYFLHYYYDAFDVIALTFSRGFSTFFGHVFWTGCIAYFFSKLNKPLCNIKFYFVLILMMMIHTLWDIETLSDIFIHSSDNVFLIIKYVLLFAYLVLSVLFTIALINRKWKITEDEVKFKSFDTKRIKTLVSIFTILVISAILVLFLYLKNKDYEVLYDYNKETRIYYLDIDDFLDYMQDGNHFEIERSKECDIDSPNSYRIYQDGILVYISESYLVDDYIVNYCYTLKGDKYVLSSVNIKIILK